MSATLRNGTDHPYAGINGWNAALGYSQIPVAARFDHPYRDDPAIVDLVEIVGFRREKALDLGDRAVRLSPT